MTQQQFLKASCDGNLDIVKTFVNSGSININCKYIELRHHSRRFKSNVYDISNLNDFWNLNIIIDWTALMLASRYGHTEIVQLLISQPSIEINSKDIEMPSSIHNI